MGVLLFSEHGSNFGDVAPNLESALPRSAKMLSGRLLRIGNVKEIRDLVVNGQEPLRCRADLNRFMIRSRRRVG